MIAAIIVAAAIFVYVGKLRNTLSQTVLTTTHELVLHDTRIIRLNMENAWSELEAITDRIRQENGQLAIGHINNTKANPDFGLVNYPSIDGKGYATSFVYGFEVFDNGDEKKVQVAKDFLKFFYAQDDLMDVSTCGLPVSNAAIEEGRKNSKLYS